MFFLNENALTFGEPKRDKLLLPVKTYSFVYRDRGSSIYKRVAEILSAYPGRGWRRLKNDSLRFQLMLGERTNLPFYRLGELLKKFYSETCL